SLNYCVMWHELKTFLPEKVMSLCGVLRHPASTNIDWNNIIFSEEVVHQRPGSLKGRKIQKD
ncbi:hypothetical protein L9F63_021203, partial [Diploptera punctata]